jgi:radical SAM modification target selenobiotic family peptide
MDKKQLKKVLAGFTIASLISGATVAVAGDDGAAAPAVAADHSSLHKKFF